MENWTKVHETSDLQYAELLKSLLLNEEIEAVTMNQKDSSNIIFGTVSVYVPNDMVQKALAIITAQQSE
ncbi:MAG TPA: DUF2007 domain-containing protein [Bacteroidia bacterium]|nr:DUF2007 domain-containing protein [Bacteroidia bacterium]